MKYGVHSKPVVRQNGFTLGFKRDTSTDLKVVVTKLARKPMADKFPGWKNCSSPSGQVGESQGK